MDQKKPPMIRRIRLRIKKHPIPWYVHPLLWMVLIYPYEYYFTVIHIPVGSITDASFLAVQQCLVFYPVIWWVLQDMTRTVALAALGASVSFIVTLLLQRWRRKR